VSSAAFPPVQLAKLALPGETVTERIVGTALSEIEMLAPLLAAGAGRLTNAITTMSRARPSTTIPQVLLRRTLISYSVTRASLASDGGPVAGTLFDPDPEAGSADAEDREGQQEQPRYDPPDPDRE
jgi:hypothetical protein